MMTTTTSPQTEAQAPAAGLSLSTFTKWLNEIQNQPAWRAKADRQMDYVDGNQLDSEVLRKQASIGMPPAIENLIGPAIESVLGLEAKTRTDWRITADTDGGDEVAEALNYKVNQAERRSGADKACSDAFLPQLCVGIGWVEVARESDPFKFKYRCTAVHRNEIFWDMKDRAPGLPNARYLIRRRWTDKDQAKLKFPAAADLIDRTMARWGGDYEPTLDGGGSTDLATSFNDERGWSIEEQEWRDCESGRVCLFEVWYRKWVKAVVLFLPDGRVVEYDESNAAHVIAVASRQVQPMPVTISKMFMSYWLGPHCLHDGPTPYRHQDFPYVQFVGKVEDRTGVPYGVVKDMVYLQDNVNSSNSKIRWGLSAVRTTRTKGAVAMDDQAFRQQVARVDADIVLNQEHMAKAGAAFKVERDFTLTDQQYKMLADSRLGIQRASGITAGFQGQQGSATSGVQESTQIEQATQSLAKLMDNFRFGRTKVGELLLSLIIEDMLGKQETVLIKGNALRPDRRVQLNVPATDPDTGIKYLTNDVERVKLSVAMNDVPSTPSFRTQQLAAMSEAFKSMPQEFQVVALPHLLSLMDVPDRDELIQDIKNAQQQLTPEMVQAKIDAAVKQALTDNSRDLKARELDMRGELQLAQVKKLIADTVQVYVESSFAAMQAGAQVAKMPMITPVADQVLAVSGFKPQGGVDPNILPAPATAAMQIKDPYIQPGGPDAAPAAGAIPPVHQNTSPEMPPVPQQPTSAMTGVETARTADNLTPN